MAEQTNQVWKETLLTKEQLSDFNFVKSRIEQLKEARIEQPDSVENIWANADRDYIPHRLKGKGKKAIVTDEDKGWRGVLVNLGESNWQSDISQPNPYVKIQIALATLIDQNPEGVFSATSKKFQATTELMKQLYKRSWEVARSKQQLKLFVFNLAKYGWACARTYPLKITRKVKNLVEYNQENRDKSEYEEKEVVEYNDIFRENLDPWNVWMDDTALPDNQFTIRDWAWRKVYALDAFQEEFGNWENAKYVTASGTTTERVSVPSSNTTEKKFKEPNLVEVYFYENRIKDLFIVIAGGIPVVISPLPISDSKGVKKLSLWQTYWNLRSATNPMGIGIYESMRYDQNLLDRIRNMTIDQLTLSIYKMFFYQGTQALTETGDIRISPGVGKQTLDPKNINWLEIPGPGNEAWQGLEHFKKDMDEASGITDPLLGTVTGKTAFEIAQAKEAALKRLKNPLENITDALNTEAYITMSLAQLIYSIPEVYTITDPILVEDYLKEIQSDPQLYERDNETDEFKAKVFPEFPLNLDSDEEGNLIETKDTRFFRVKPNSLNWEGVINIKSQSVLTQSKQLDKALNLEMYNVLIPLLQGMNQERMMMLQSGQGIDIDDLTTGKLAKELIKLYDKDPRDILPNSWLQPTQPTPQPLFIPAEQAQQGLDPSLQVPQGLQQASNTNPAQIVQPQAQGMISKLSSKLGSLNPFK